MLKKSSLLLLLLFLFAGNVKSQTLNVGDIAIIGYHSDNSDQFVWIALTDIPAGESIYFTDKGWDANLNTWFGNSEGHIQWTSPAGGISCGTIIHVGYAGGTFPTTGGGSTVIGDGSWSLLGGDQILAYRGGSGHEPAAPFFLHAINADYDATDYNAGTTWSNGNSTTSSFPSMLPQGLTNGVNCISIFPAPGPEFDNNRYTGTLSGTPASVFASINNASNWTAQNDVTIPMDAAQFATPSIICATPCTDPDVPVLTATPSAVCPNSTSTISWTGNLNDATNWHIYTGSCGGTEIGTTATGSFDVSPSITTTYFIRGEGGCVTPGSCASIAVTAEDNVAPTAVCQDIFVYVDGSGSASIVAADIDGGSFDDCGSVSLSASPTNFNCSDISPLSANMIITGVYDGPLSGGTPKGVELYVVNDISDLSQYGLGSANNGGGSDGEEFTFPALAATAGQFIYVASEPTQFLNWFGFSPDYTTTSMLINGDDAVELFENGTVIDVFGDINVDGSGQPWDYLDGWALRVNNNTPSSSFDLNDWTFSGINIWDGEITNAGAASPLAIGTYSHPSTGVLVTLTVDDGNGNTDMCTARVTVLDSVTPVITCPGDQIEMMDPSCMFTLPDYSSLVSTVPTYCPGVTITQTPAAGTVITGTTTITMKATNGSGYNSSCSFDVILNDATPPTAVCQNITAYLDGAGLASIVAADIDGGSSDDCSSITLSASTTSFTCADVGPNNVTLTVTDGSSSTANCVAIVTILDTISPVSSCPGNQLELASPTCDLSLPDYTGLVTVTDNCGNTTITQSPAAGTIITGLTTVTMTTDDGNGNTSVCSFDVDLDLSSCIGTECSNAITVTLDPCGDSQIETGSTVGGSPSTEVFCGTSLGSGGANWYTFTGDGGTWTASSVSTNTNYDTKIWVYDGICGALNCVTGNDDFSGVQSQVTFTTTVGIDYYVVIGGFSANEGNYELTFSNAEAVAPVADAPTLADINGTCEILSLTAPTATDNCSAVTVTNDVTLPITTNTTITWTYTDASGNSSTQTQNVVLNDAILPTASNAAPLSVECIGDIPAPDPTVITDEADNCATPTVTWTSDVSDGNTCPETITRTYTVTDGSGNFIDVTQTITVQDITLPTASNPTTLNVQCASDVPAPSTGWVADEADNCSTPTVAWVSDVSDGLSCPETITRTFSVTDDCGNTINVTQLVVINDDDAPAADVTNLPTETAYCDVTLTAPTATDNCSGSITGTTTTLFPINNLGTTTVTWTYTDDCGNVSTQTQDVVIETMETGVSMANDGITILSENSESGVTYQWIDCVTDQPIAGETNHNYTPTYGSDFAVITTINGCSDTSACVNSVVGLTDHSIIAFTLYPNPTLNGEFRIETDAQIESIKVLDLLGRMIGLPTQPETGYVNGSELASGKYLVKITVDSGEVLTTELIVQH